MRTAVRLLVGAIALCALIGLALIWSWWLTLFAVLGLLCAALAKYFDKIGGAIGLALVLIVVLIALGYFGVLPSTSRKAPVSGELASCLAIPSENIFRIFNGNQPRQAPAAAAQSALERRRIEIERDGARDLFQAQRAVDVDANITAISRILDLESAPGLEEARRTVSSGVDDIRKFLNEKGLSGREERMRSYQALEQRVDAVLAQLKQARRNDALAPLASALFEADNLSPMSQLAQKMFSLEESLLALTGESVQTLPEYSIEWGGKGGHATYREAITIRSRQDALLDSVDASLLKREADSAGIPLQLWLEQDNGALTKVDDPAAILIEPRRKSARLIYDRIGSVLEPAYCKPAPLGTITRLVFIWPPSGSSVRLAGVLAKGDERLPVWFSIDRSKPESQFVQDIRLPQRSFFASARPLDMSTRDGSDVLRSSQHEDLALQNFTAGQNDWIEVFRDYGVLRTGFPQKFKEYVVLDNALSAVFVFLVGALVMSIFPKLRAGR